MERHGTAVRLVLLLSAVALMVLGWVVPLFLSAEAAKGWPKYQTFAAFPATLWAAVDALWAHQKKKAGAREAEIQSSIHVILQKLEDLAVEKNVPLKLSDCGVKVWKVGRLSWRDRMHGETRRPLVRIAASPLYLPSHSSGLDWRVGMGIMGTALQQNDKLAVDVAESWSSMPDSSRQAWDTLPEDRRFGLSYEEFLLLQQPTAGGRPGGPMVIATPIYHRDQPRGVTALDLPPAVAIRLGLDDILYDAPDQKILTQLYACTEIAFPANQTTA